MKPNSDFNELLNKVEQDTNTTTVIEAEQIHYDMMEAGKQYAIKLQTTIESVSIPTEVTEKLQTLESLGLRNTRNAIILRDSITKATQINQAKQFNLDGVKFLVKAIEYFGENTFLVPYDSFKELLKKYNLICGKPEDYTGTIPEKNIEDLVKFKATMEKKMPELKQDLVGYCVIRRIIYYTSLSKIDSEDTIKDLLQELVRFPFLMGEEDMALINVRNGQGYLDKISGMTDGIHGLVFKDYDTPNEGQIFLCAAPGEIEPLVEIQSRVYPLDPIAFCLTRYGVLIPTMWGIESEDEILKKYKEATSFLGQWTRNYFVE